MHQSDMCLATLGRRVCPLYMGLCTKDSHAYNYTQVITDECIRCPCTPNQHSRLHFSSKDGLNAMTRKDLHTIFILTLWELWKHHNAIFFDGASPLIDCVLCRVRSEGMVWATAGLIKGHIDHFLGRVGRLVTREE